MTLRSFAKAPESVPAARAYVVRALPELDDEARQVAALLVSELATNALLYGDSDFDVTVDYSAASQRARVEVRNAGPGRPTMQHPASTAEHGRGLQLVAALSASWGVDAAPNGGSKVVWFELLAHEH
jgi:anti-sigma regulatory factor (Ser/Thr protein kinase)